MRERYARLLALLSGTLVVLLSAGFAAIQNPAVATATPTAAMTPVADHAAASDAAELERGRALFDEHGCVRCHSVAGHGSPRSPLDGVGARMDAEETRHWIVGDDAVRDELAPRVLAAKAPYKDLPAADLDAMVAWLQTLR
jgi:mono/diheme cytochrome c family protein